VGPGPDGVPRSPWTPWSGPELLFTLRWSPCLGCLEQVIRTAASLTFLELDTFLPTRYRCSSLVSGYLSSTGSYSVSLPWSGHAFWTLRRPASEILATSLWTSEVAVSFDQWNGAYSLSHLPVLQLARLVHSRWLAPL